MIVIDSAGNPRTATASFDMTGFTYTIVAGARLAGIPIRAQFMFVLNVTVAGTGTLTPSFRLMDDAADEYWDFWTIAAAITGTGRYVYLCHPGEPTASGVVTELFPRHIPMAQNMQVQIAHSDGSSWTYTGDVSWYLMAGGGS